MHNSDFWSKIPSLYGSQTWPVVLWMQNSVISIRNTSLYWSQPSCVVFGSKAVTFGPEYQVSKSPRQKLSFCAWKTATLAAESLVSMCPSPHLWFLHAKQSILDQNFKYLWVPALICGFCMPNNVFCPRITSLYGSQTSPALECNQNGVICTRISSLYWFQPSSMVLCLKNSDFMTRLTSLYGSQTSSVVLSTHNHVLSTRINRLYCFQPSPVVLCMQNSDFRIRITSLCGSKTPPVVFACKTAISGPE